MAYDRKTRMAMASVSTMNLWDTLMIIGFSLLCYMTGSLAHPSGEKYLLRDGTGNSINALEEQIFTNDHQGDIHVMHKLTDTIGGDTGLSVIPTSFYNDVTKRLSDLETKVDELSGQNRELKKKLRESISPSDSVYSLLLKLEKKLDIDKEAEYNDVDDNDDDTDGVGEKAEGEHAPVDSTSTDAVKMTLQSSADQLLKCLPDQAKNTFELMEKSLAQLTDRTTILEADVSKMKTSNSGGEKPQTHIDDDDDDDDEEEDAFHHSNRTSVNIVGWESRRGGNILPARVPAVAYGNMTRPRYQPRKGNSAGANASRKVAFSVAATRSQMGTSSPQIVQFQYVITNSGEDFMAANNTFVCSVPGWYFFTYSMRTAVDMNLGVLLMKNDEYLASIFTDASDRNTMDTQSVVVQLEAGDAVWLRLAPSPKYGLYSDTYRYSTFSGFLIFKT